MQLARLFQAIALSEDAQARRFILQLRGQIQVTETNCVTAFEEEIPDLIARYNGAAEAAGKDGEQVPDHCPVCTAAARRFIKG